MKFNAFSILITNILILTLYKMKDAMNKNPNNKYSYENKTTSNFNSSIIMGNKLYKSGVIPNFFKFHDCFPNENLNFESNDILTQLSNYNEEIKKRIKYSLNQRFYLDESKLSDLMNNQKTKLLSLEKLRNLYYKNSNLIKPSLSTFRRMIRKNHGYTYKSTNVIHEKRKSIKFSYEFYHYLECYKKMLENQELLVYVDESTFVEKAYRKKIWTKINSTDELTNNGRTNSDNFIVAVSKYGIVHHNFISGKNNGKKFYNFIEQVVKNLKHKNQYSKLFKQNKIRIIFDNSKVHVCRMNRLNYKHLPIKISTLPTYFPQANSAEFLFAFLKSKCKSVIFKSR